MISYYELLGMIKDGKAPNKIRVHLTSEPREYRMIFDCGECNYYELIGNENNDYKYYLSDSYLESSMFDKTIELLDEKKIPKKLLIGLKTTKENEIHNTLIIGNSQYELNEKEEMICKKIHEIIDYLNSKGE